MSFHCPDLDARDVWELPDYLKASTAVEPKGTIVISPAAKYYMSVPGEYPVKELPAMPQAFLRADYSYPEQVRELVVETNKRVADWCRAYFGHQTPAGRQLVRYAGFVQGPVGE